MALLDDPARERIAAAVQAAEARTSGEIVVAVVPQSAGYELRRALAALAWALLSCVVVVELWPAFPAVLALAAVVPAFAVYYAVFATTPLLRLLVPGAAADAAVLAKAHELFARAGVHATRERTGVLLLVSELEHKVVLLGDRGIDAVQGEAGWQREVSELVDALKGGRAAEGIVATVERLGAILAERFPRRSDDQNELSDRVIEER
jgi:putative membrane protein